MNNSKINGVKTCPVHKTYKGRKPTKRNCPDCKKLYETLQAKSRETKPFRSLFSSDFNVSMFHMLSELACYQRFGKLPPYFWRKATPCSQKAKDHYQKTYKMLMSWQKKKFPAKNNKWNPLEALNTVFYYLSTNDRDIDDFARRNVTVIKEIKTREKHTPEEAIDFGSTKRKSRFKGLNNLGDDNG